jgi:hypothetical protein
VPAEEGRNETGTEIDNEDPHHERTNLEVGQMLATRSLPCVLALVMEGWADWLLVVPQFRAEVFVFCDGLPEVSRKLFEDSGLDAGEWMSVSRFWEHGVLRDPKLCVLLSGSHRFVNAALSRIPKEVRVVAAVSQSKRRQKSEGEERLRWRTVRHQDVGGVTTIRCDLGFPGSGGSSRSGPTSNGE